MAVLKVETYWSKDEATISVSVRNSEKQSETWLCIRRSDPVQEGYATGRTASHEPDDKKRRRINLEIVDPPAPQELPNPV